MSHCYYYLKIIVFLFQSFFLAQLTHSIHYFYDIEKKRAYNVLITLRIDELIRFNNISTRVGLFYA